jgi:hypothetical protein
LLCHFFTGLIFAVTNSHKDTLEFSADPEPARRCITFLSQSRNVTQRGSDGSNPTLIVQPRDFNKTLLFEISVVEPELHHFGGDGAVTGCGYGGPGSKLNLKNRLIIKNVTNRNSFFLFLFTFTTT